MPLEAFGFGGADESRVDIRLVVSAWRELLGVRSRLANSQVSGICTERRKDRKPSARKDKCRNDAGIPFEHTKLVVRWC